MDCSIESGVYEFRSCLHGLIQKGIFTDVVISMLLPNDEPLLYEKILWDYKLALPVSPKEIDKAGQLDYNIKVAELMKDAVAFYNSFGGYIVAGVRDNPRQVEGFDNQFNVDDFNKRLKSATGHDIDCHYSVIKKSIAKKNVGFGLLFIPQRHDSILPAQFKKDAPENPKGKKAYSKGEYYLRSGDECRPAKDPEDFSLLCTQGKRVFSVLQNVQRQSMLDNNLGPKDPDLIQFIGREKYLSRLWEWLLEKYSPCKLLAGLGGVGKTTIARKFAETVTVESPLGFERVVWLSAKGKYWRSFSGQVESAPSDEIKYYDTKSFLVALLLELGFVQDDLDEDVETDELIEKTIETLCFYPSLVVVDDIDSLNESEQQTIFQTLIQIFGNTVSKGTSASKALLTARLDLGAAPAQLLRVTGLEYEEFVDYLKIIFGEFGLDVNLLGKKKLIEKFHSATDGSPIFSNAVLRLVSYGDKLETAIEQWRGSEGEEVRKFAFEKEIGFLSDAELRTLFVLSELKNTSIVELQHVLETNRTKIYDNLARLRKYHLIVRADESPSGGSIISIPQSIKLMQPLLENHIRNSEKLKNRCKEARATTAYAKGEVALVINKVVSLWKNGEDVEALEQVEWGSKRFSKEPDIFCLLGRAYLRVDSDRDNAKKADAAFRKAHSLACKRPELFPHWIEAKKILADWQGIIDVSQFSDQASAGNAFFIDKILAIRELGREAKVRGDIRRSSEHYLEAAESIQYHLDKRLAKGIGAKLIELKIDLVREYIATTDSLYRDQNEYLYTWFACCKAFDLYVRPQPIVYLGLQRLKDWWSAVEYRMEYDKKAPNTLTVQLKQIDKMLEALFKQQRNTEPVYNEMIDTRDYLYKRKESYIKSHLD